MRIVVVAVVECVYSGSGDGGDYGGSDNVTGD